MVDSGTGECFDYLVRAGAAVDVSDVNPLTACKVDSGAPG